MNQEKRGDLLMAPGPQSGYFTVYPYQVGIIVCDGLVEYVFEGEKRRIPRGEVQTYVISTAPFSLSWQFKGVGVPLRVDDVLLDPPLLTTDGQNITVRIDLTLSVVPEDTLRLMQLLGLDGDAISKPDVADMIKGELQRKLLSLDLHGITDTDIRGNRHRQQDVSQSLSTELASAIERFGLQLDDFYLSWLVSFKRPQRTLDITNDGTTVLKLDRYDQQYLDLVLNLLRRLSASACNLTTSI